MTIDLSLQETISDPLIGLMRRADGISTRRFVHLLTDAADAYQETALVRLHDSRIDHFYSTIGAGMLRPHSERR